MLLSIGFCEFLCILFTESYVKVTDRNMTDQAETMSNRIRARREYLQLSQEAVASALSMSPVGYGHWERDRTEPSASQLKELAKVLHVSVSYLVGEQPREQFEDEEAARWYNGLPPHLRPAARATLRALYEQSDREDAA